MFHIVLSYFHLHFDIQPNQTFQSKTLFKVFVCQIFSYLFYIQFTHQILNITFLFYFLFSIPCIIFVFYNRLLFIVVVLQHLFTHRIKIKLDIIAPQTTHHLQIQQTTYAHPYMLPSACAIRIQTTQNQKKTAVIGGAVVGLLCAILVVMFIVYRMRKKDEGSYALDEPKRSPASNSYAKNATNREFYA